MNALAKSNKHRNPFHRRTVSQPSQEVNVPKVCRRYRGSDFSQRLHRQSSETPSLSTKSEFEKSLNGKNSGMDLPKLAPLQLQRSSQQRYMDKIKNKQTSPAVILVKNGSPIGKNRKRKRTTSSSQSMSPNISQRGGGESGIEKYGNKHVPKVEVEISQSKSSKIRAQKTRRRLNAWEIKQMLNKGIEKMRKEGVPIIRDVESEIYNHVLEKESNSSLLSEELVLKQLWEVEPFSVDWFLISRHRALAWKAKHGRRTKKKKQPEVSENDSDKLHKAKYRPKAERRAEVKNITPRPRDDVEIDSRGEESTTARAVDQEICLESASEHHGSLEATKNNFKRTSKIKRKKMYNLSDSSEESDDNKTIGSIKTLIKHENGKTEKAELNQETSHKINCIKPIVQRNHLASSGELKITVPALCSIDLTADSDGNEDKGEDVKPESSQKLKCPCCGNFFLRHHIEQHVDLCLSVNDATGSNHSDEAYARELQRQFRAEEEKERRNLDSCGPNGKLNRRQNQEARKRFLRRKRREKVRNNTDYFDKIECPDSEW